MMGSNLEFVEYVCDRMRGAGEITYKKMFGEYGIYLDGKFIAAVCDDQFFVKITEAGRKILIDPIETPMYEGGSPAFLIEDVDDTNTLSELLAATWDELPFPKAKKPKKDKSL